VKRREGKQMHLKWYGIWQVQAIIVLGVCRSQLVPVWELNERLKILLYAQNPIARTLSSMKVDLAIHWTKPRVTYKVKLKLMIICHACMMYCTTLRGLNVPVVD